MYYSNNTTHIIDLNSIIYRSLPGFEPSSPGPKAVTLPLCTPLTVELRLNNCRDTSLFSLAKDSLLVPSGYMGAPTVLIEKLLNGKECLTAIKELEKILKVLAKYYINLVEFFISSPLKEGQRGVVVLSR